MGVGVGSSFCLVGVNLYGLKEHKVNKGVPGGAMPAQSAARIGPLAGRRDEVRAIESGGRREGRESLPVEVEESDRRLDGGGLAMAALHEMVGERAGLFDEAAATLFVAGIAARQIGRAHV